MNGMLKSVAEELVRQLPMEGEIMPSQRMKVLLDELKLEMERGAYRKNVKVSTLIRKLKKDGVSSREESILRIHIQPKFGRMTLHEAIGRAKEYTEIVAASKVKSTGKKELRLFSRLIQSGDPSYKLPKVHFQNPGKKFHTGQILEVDEILKVIGTKVYPPYRLPCKVALYTGMRMGNVFGLTKKDVDLKRREVRFTLNKIPKPMVVPISNKLAEVFNQVPWPLEDSALLFPLDSKSDQPKKKVTIQVSRAFTRAGYPWFSFHKLRHTAACHLLEQGVDIPVISALLGHSSIKVTMEFYARVKPKALRKAVGLFDV
jgi:integrase